MALPELTLPTGTPAFNADGHSIEMVEMYADVPVRTGHDRRRRLYTTVPRFVTVKLELTYPQMLAMHEWFEGPLQVGVNSFSAQVANQGPGLLWWSARFAEPYTADADEAGQLFIVTARLLLDGQGSVTGPYTPEMVAAISVGLSGSAVIQLPNPLTTSIVVALRGVDGALPSAVDLEKRWTWQNLNYAWGRTSDVTYTQESNQRSWMGI